jgi:hypothetical protein
VAASHPRFTAPAWYTHPAITCPRCDGHHIAPLEGSRSNPYLWHECDECQHLWALPRDWAAHGSLRYAGGIEKRH